MPATSAIMIQVVSEGRFMCLFFSRRSLLAAAPFEFFPQHVEKHFLGRAYQADGMFRSPANHVVAFIEKFTDLTVDGKVCDAVVTAIDHLNHAFIRNHQW